MSTTQKLPFSSLHIEIFCSFLDLFWEGFSIFINLPREGLRINFNIPVIVNVHENKESGFLMTFEKLDLKSRPQLEKRDSGTPGTLL